VLTKHPLRFAAAIILIVASSVVALRSTLVVADADSTATAVTVAVGGETRTTLHFAAPSSVASDIAVLLDSTGSQSSFMAATSALALGAIDRLADPDVRVAVAASGDVPTFPFGTSTDTPYRLALPMNADRATWSATLTGLAAVEGGGDEAEGQLGALVELLTNPLTGEPKAQPVVFSPGRRHVVVLTADHPPHLSSDTWCRAERCVAYPGPTKERVQQALADAAVTLIVVSDGDVGVLAELARTSGGVVVDVAATDSPSTIDEVLRRTRVTVSPTISGCDGLSVRPAGGVVLATAGQEGAVEVVLSARTDLAIGSQTCTIAFGTRQHLVTVATVAPCGTPTTTTAPLSSVPTTTELTTTTTTADPSPTSTTPATTTTEATATTTTEPIGTGPTTTTDATATTTTEPIGTGPTTTTDAGATAPTTSTAAGPAAPTTVAVVVDPPPAAPPSSTVVVSSTLVPPPMPCPGPLPAPSTTNEPIA
jgi:hypothetical protein